MPDCDSECNVKQKQHPISKREKKIVLDVLVEVLPITMDERTSDSSLESRRKDDRRSSKKHKYRNENRHKKKSHRQESHISSDDYRPKERKRHKKESKRGCRKEKKRRDGERSIGDSDPLRRNAQLADALFNVLELHPLMATDLPIMLVRLGGGASFDLTSMTDRSAATSLENLFEHLEAFGMHRDSFGAWIWKGPPGATNTELVLVKVIRTILDQTGLTIDSIVKFEKVEERREDKAIVKHQKSSSRQSKIDKVLTSKAESILGTSKDKGLQNDLIVLCKMIMNGENVALDGLPDKNLKESLESLLQQCGLEKAEIEDSDSEENEISEPIYGYGLPEDGTEEALRQLNLIVYACTSFAARAMNDRRPLKGPLLNPTDYEKLDQMGKNKEDEQDSSDDEGPAPLGAQSKESAYSKEAILAEAKLRDVEMQQVKGIAVVRETDPSIREEWMLVPGKFDFLSSIKSGQALKSRTFRGESKSALDTRVLPVNPDIQAEMDSIMQAHSDARGPSLVEQHRQRKAEVAADADDNKSWNWNRDNDLDSGRRVDKNALNMVLGGAVEGLKNKFQGGFSGR